MSDHTPMDSPIDTPALADIAIIGAGIAGASLAWALTHAPDQATPPRVLLLERESQPGYHTTGRSAALYMASYGTPAIRALTRASRDFYDAPPPGFTDHPLLSPRGVLHVATAAELPALDVLQAELQAIDPTVRRVGTAELLATVPVLRPEAAVAGLVEDSAADIDVHALHQGYLRGARAAGATLLTHAELTGLAHDGEAWTLTLADGRCLRARQLVNAAGAWADAVGVLAGAAPIGLEPRRRSAFTFEAPAGTDASRWPAVAAVVADHGPDGEAWYIKPDAGLILGSPANADLVTPHDVVPEELDIALGIHRIEQATTLSIRRPRSTWAGLRSFVPDGDLVVGPDGAVPGFFWLAAQGGYGIQSAPGVAALAASLLLGRPLPAELVREGVDPAASSPARLRR
ncbi:FAD-dependent oxidoreductase [Ideonella sp. DXS22W]|uniref:FAD-dependent oxidoreductase n=1 Tax=Pseudaquabacterium inlustre TaxID=2984192 RepID=A0ABU9CHN9_9BURK